MLLGLHVIIRLDQEATLALVQRLRADYPAEAETIAALARNFAYDKLIALAATVSVSCVIPLMINDDPWWGRSAATFRRVVPLDPGGALVLENDTGDVEIRGWDRSEVEVSAEEGWGRLSRPGFGFGGWGRASSPDIGVDKIENLVKIADIVAIALKALHRLYKKFLRLDQRKHRTWSSLPLPASSVASSGQS